MPETYEQEGIVLGRRSRIPMWRSDAHLAHVAPQGSHFMATAQPSGLVAIRMAGRPRVPAERHTQPRDLQIRFFLRGERVFAQSTRCLLSHGRNCRPRVRHVYIGGKAEKT